MYLDGKQVQRFRHPLVLRAGKNPEGYIGARLTGYQCRTGTEPAFRLPFEDFGRTPASHHVQEHHVIKRQELKNPGVKSAQTTGTVPVWPPSNHFLSLFFFLSIFPFISWGNDTYLIEAAYNRYGFSSVKNSHSDTGLQNFQEGHVQWWREGREAPLAFFLFQGRKKTQFLHRTLVLIYEKSLTSHKSLRLFPARRLLPSWGWKAKAFPLEFSLLFYFPSNT